MEALLILALIIVILFAVIANTYTPEEMADKKGQQGEEKVKSILARLPREEYMVLNDVLLPTEKGTAQIDHIVVSVYGVFVIETKNFQGKMYGGRDGEKWSQYLNGEQFIFRNPIKQNISHVIAIKKATLISNNNIIPLIVFTGNAILKVFGCDEVISDGMLYDTICSYKKRVLTPELMEVYARILDDKMEENSETKKAHINEVKEKMAHWDQEVKAGQCPCCSGYLVLRKGKYGNFYGCSNYPKCKYTKNV